MKKVEWLKNYNKKLHSNIIFFHLDRAPLIGVPESKFPQKVCITVTDGSVQPMECYCLYFTRFKMQNVVDTITLLSHGVPAEEYFNEVFQDQRINWNTEMALYVYSADENIKDFFMPVLDNNVED